MWSNYLRITVRALVRQRSYTAITILGLSIGMAAFILIMMYVQHERSFDSYHDNLENMYRLCVNFIGSDGERTAGFCSIAPPVAPLFEEQFPEVEKIARVLEGNQTLFSFNDSHVCLERTFMAEPDIIPIFSLSFLSGESSTALQEPFTIIMNESNARLLFGEENPVGKQVVIDNEYTCRVDGVFEDMPANSHVHWDFLISFATLRQIVDQDYYQRVYEGNNFSNNMTVTYLCLEDGTDLSTVQARIPDFIDRNAGWSSENPSSFYQPFLQPVSDIHLHSRQDNEIEPNSDIRYIRLFTLIAVFILLLACVNFINLSTARSSLRAREVGLRKVIGAQRSSLVLRFLMESVIITGVSLLIAIGIVYMILPAFNQFAGREISISAIPLQTAIPFLAVIGFLVAFVAGVYPAFYISAFRPSIILRGELTKGSKGNWMRQALVVFQFVIGVALIISVGIVYKQFQFIHTTNLGFDNENVVILHDVNDELSEHWNEFKNRLEASSAILHITGSKRIPTGRLSDWNGYRLLAEDAPEFDHFRLPNHRVGYDFCATYGIDVLAGRDFSEEVASDADEAFLLNESAVRAFGWELPEEAIGQPISYGGNKGLIIGVIHDFHFESLHHPILPMIFYHVNPNQYNHISIRIAPGNPSAALATIQQVWSELQPDYPLQYDFLDDRINMQYRADTQLMELFSYFSILAIVIACLGLIGLSSYTVEQRTKEIGIRKVLGASVFSILVLFSKQLVRLVLIGGIIAMPVAGYAMREWLEGFEYHTTLSPEPFALALAPALIVALVSILSQVIRSANMNPTDALRRE